MKNMKNMKNMEEKLTAYILGELNAAERQEIENLIKQNPAAAKTLQEIREVTKLLADDMAAQKSNTPALRPEQKRRVLKGNAAKPRRNIIIRLGVYAAAAAILLVFGAYIGSMSVRGTYSNSKNQARNSSPDTTWIEYTCRRSLTDDLPGKKKADISKPKITEEQSKSPTKSEEGKNDRWQAEIIGIPSQRCDIHFGLEINHGDSGWEYNRPSGWNREAYDHIIDNPFRDVKAHPLSTFSIDVDTASYANLRRLLRQGTLPPKGAVRIEEMINYFDYKYSGPSEEDKHPFAAHADIATCPWNSAHKLLRVALKGREIKQDKRPDSNLVFLLDVSGSMRPENKLPLVKKAMTMLANNLNERDRVAIVVYAGAAGLVLDSTPGSDREKITGALDRLNAGGSTAGAAGIRLAYKVAEENLIKGGVNRVIICTDGDFNVGTTSESELVDLITEKAKSGVFLSVLGFGMGNYQDSRLEKLADKGNGNYAYIDTISEARKVLVEQLSGTLVTIAKDVKIQIEFNPARVAGYRLIGYENRILAKEDFNDDKKDAGEIGAGHTVTALYEIVPAGENTETPDVDDLKYQTPSVLSDAANNDEILTLKLRYKQPDGDKSELMTYPVADETADFGKTSDDFRFAASVAAFGMILRDSEYKGTYTYDAVIEAAQSSLGEDANGYRREFVELVKLAKELKKN